MCKLPSPNAKFLLLSELKPLTTLRGSSRGEEAASPIIFALLLEPLQEIHVQYNEDHNTRQMMKTRLLTSLVQNPAGHQRYGQSNNRHRDLVRNALVVFRERSAGPSSCVWPRSCSRRNVADDLLVQARDGDLVRGKRGSFRL